MQPILKRLIVGTATALLAAGCASTGTTSGTGAAGADSTGAVSTSSTASAASTAQPSDQANAGGTPSAAVSTTASGAPSSAQPPPSAAAKATVYGCDQQPVSQPKSYTLMCGDGGIALDQLAWSGWGKAKATATGVQIQNSCDPSCAAGSPVSTKATVTLSGLSGGHYTKLHVATAKGATDYTIDGMGPVAAG